ncbi:hypothetical protein [Streptomyces sp. NPDC056291]|uniref:hypothetical protein n=1 Tax=Streptomyces sp. NPDC056291 TaxID=3345772 RepID=UPI0035DA8CAA
MGNPVVHLVGLSVCVIVLLLPGVAMLRGWVPPGFKKRTGGLRLRGIGCLVWFGFAVIGTVLALTVDSADVANTAWLSLLFLGAASSFVIAIKADRADRRARRDEPHGE